MTITIETNIPVPERAAATKYPFADMVVGDSFQVTGKGTTLSRAAAAYQKKHEGASVKFAVRTNKTDGTARCWRIA